MTCKWPHMTNMTPQISPLFLLDSLQCQVHSMWPSTRALCDHKKSMMQVFLKTSYFCHSLQKLPCLWSLGLLSWHRPLWAVDRGSSGTSQPHRPVTRAPCRRPWSGHSHSLQIHKGTNSNYSRASICYWYCFLLDALLHPFKQHVPQHITCPRRHFQMDIFSKKNISGPCYIIQ